MISRCEEARSQLLDYQRGLLASAAHEAVRAHLDECPQCAHEEAVERNLSEALERRLPQYAAPFGLKRRLTAGWPAPSSARPRRHRQWRSALTAAGLAAALALLVVLVQPSVRPPLVDGASALALEAVNDHLRILEPGRRLEVQSDDVHQVRPWFAGRLDFAPIVPFAGDGDFPLRGGAIERFLDRRAAVFVYGRRLHTVSLLVFRSDGLPWPEGEDSGMRRTASLTVRGFNVLLWRERDLGYALVSDLNAAELRALGTRLAAPATRS
jgi:anti-sigma factor RsiW